MALRQGSPPVTFAHAAATAPLPSGLDAGRVSGHCGTRNRGEDRRLTDRKARPALAILAAGAILLAAGWVEATVGVEVQRRGAQFDDPAVTELILSLGYFAVACAVLAIALLVGWAESLLVACTYAVAGAFFLVLGAILWTFAATRNDVPPVFPEPIASVIGDLYAWQSGPFGAVPIVAGAMLLTALISLGREYRQHPRR